MEYGTTVWDPYQKYNSDNIEIVQHKAARLVKNRYNMFDELRSPPLSQRRQEAQLILFYKIINSFTQVPFEGILI